jgi:endonuclease-3
MYRWGLTNGKNVQQTEKDAKRIFPETMLERIYTSNYLVRKRIFSCSVVGEKDIITKTIGI